MTRRLVHWIIVTVLFTGFVSALYMVFVVHRVGGHLGPLFGHANEMAQDFFIRRRLYALEAWMTFGFLAVYLALTWLKPPPSARE